MKKTEPKKTEPKKPEHLYAVIYSDGSRTGDLKIIGTKEEIEEFFRQEVVVGELPTDPDDVNLYRLTHIPARFGVTVEWGKK